MLLDNTARNTQTHSSYIINKIQELDLTPIKYKLIKESGWQPEQAIRAEKLYRGFLSLSALYPKQACVPTQEIDDFWHAHILDTRKYMADCQDIFGYYLHHFPYTGLQGDEEAAIQAFHDTRQKMLDLGIAPEILGIDASDCSSCSSSSCSSSSCSSGSNDSGGHSHNDTPSTPTNDRGSDNGWIVPLISSCSTSSNNTDDARRTPAQERGIRERLRDWWNKKPANTPRTSVPGVSRKPTPPARKLDSWTATTDPRHFVPEQRPGEAELEQLVKSTSPTRH